MIDFRLAFTNCLKSFVIIEHKRFVFVMRPTFFQISDAKITVTDPKPGAAKTAIIISGTPEQTCAAQSLIHAFVVSESIAA